MRKRWIIIALCAVILAGVCTAVFASGKSDDPLVSAGWLYDTLIPRLRELLKDESGEQATLAKEYDTRLGLITIPDDLVFNTDDGLTVLTMAEDDTFKPDAYGSFLLQSGRAKLRCGSSEVLDLTTGRVCTDGAWLLPEHRYFVSEGADAVILCYSDVQAFVESDGQWAHDVLFPAADRFLDIQNHWAESNICRMAEIGAVNGIEKHAFVPDTKVSRAMFITVLYRLFGSDGDQYGNVRFTDVQDGDWYAPYVRWGAANGLMIGYGDGTFGPDDMITREQMATVLARCCADYGVELMGSSTTASFSDNGKISAWAQEAVELAHRLGLLNGRTTGEFDPAGSLSRAEMCTVLCRLYDRTK